MSTDLVGQTSFVGLLMPLTASQALRERWPEGSAVPLGGPGQHGARSHGMCSRLRPAPRCLFRPPIPAMLARAGGTDLQDMPIIALIVLALAWTGVRGTWSILDALTDSPTILVFAAAFAVASLPGYLALKSPLHSRLRRIMLRLGFGLWAILLVPGLASQISMNMGAQADCRDQYEETVGPSITSFDASYDDWRSGIC